MWMIRAFAVVVVLAAPSLARAQWDNPYKNIYTGRSFNNPTSALLDTMIMHSQQRQQLLALMKRKPATGAKPAASAHQPASASDFRPGRGRPVVDSFLTSAELTAEQRTALQQVIDATFTAVEQQLRKHSVASALGFTLGAAIEILQGTELPDDASRELIAGVNDLLAGSADFRKLKDRDKQTMYDTLILTGALLVAFHGAGESDPAAKQAAMTMAKSVVQQLTGAAP